MNLSNQNQRMVDAAREILEGKNTIVELKSLKDLHGAPSRELKIPVIKWDKKRKDLLAFLHKKTNSNVKEVYIDGDDIVIVKRGKPHMIPAFEKSSGITLWDVIEDIYELLDSIQHQDAELSEASKPKETREVTRIFQQYINMFDAVSYEDLLYRLARKTHEDSKEIDDPAFKKTAVALMKAWKEYSDRDGN